MKITFSGPSPWNNPSLPVYQHEFNLIYLPLQYLLHADDAVVSPVSLLSILFLDSSSLTTPQTNRDLGVLRNQIGAEGLAAVIEHIPTQWNKRMLADTTVRAAYIKTLLQSPQRPFIWEFFRPGTIEIPRGKETYYDEVHPPPYYLQADTNRHSRNAMGHSNQPLYCMHFPCTSRHTEFNCAIPSKMLGVQLGRWHLL
jgi:hypothetical protein